MLAVPTDVSKPAEAERLIERTVERFGRIDVLINTAGLMLVGAEPTLTLDDLRSLMDVNFWGAVHTSRAALPHMRKAQIRPDRQRIVHRRPVRGPSYAALHGQQVCPHRVHEGPAARGLRDNVFVTGIYPSTIRTGGHRHAWFKGDQEAEYSWFSLGDVIPGLAISAEKAARMAIRAIQCGDPEVVIGLPARLADRHRRARCRTGRPS